ncbi:hypothetical protein ABZ319_06875 [Nocardia sp. NPDC005978]|uniref:hypothetical protein n=1 Tax=Nocardia sp. NPDC005978 TaxID=3156725 RepID=UPI0033A54953
MNSSPGSSREDPHYTMPNGWDFAAERLALLGAAAARAELGDERRRFYAPPTVRAWARRPSHLPDARR